MTQEYIDNAADAYVGHQFEYGEDFSCYQRREAFKHGINFALGNVWKSAKGDDLPDIDKEVIALVGCHSGYKVVYAHRPCPYGFDGKNIDTGEVTHYMPELYDEKGWNQPDVMWWLDVDLPKIIGKSIS